MGAIATRAWRKESALTRLRTEIGTASLDRDHAAAALLRTSSWLTIIGASAFEIFQLYSGIDPVRVIAVAVVGLLAGVALWLLRRGQLRLAGWLVTSTLFAIGCASIWLGGGLNAAGAVTLIILLIMSAMTLEWQPTIAWTVLSIAALSGFAFAESQGWLPPQTSRRPILELWFIYAFHLAAATWLVTFSAGAVRGILGRLGTRTAELADSEERFARLVEQSPDIIVALDDDGTIAECSQAIEPLFGYRPDEVIGRTFNDLGVMPDPTVEQNMAAFHSLMIGEEPTLTVTQVTHRDGSHRWVEANPRVVHNENGSARLYLVIRDATERIEAEQRRTELEARLVALGRLEALGRMAGGLAHDFNNLLLVILSNAELLESNSDPASRPLLQEIQVAGRAGADLTTQLLAFAGQQIQEIGVTDVGNQLSKLDGLLQRLLPSNVRLVVHNSRGLPAARGDPAQFDQVIVNLVMNAQQSMPDGGTITIETSSVQVGEDECQRHPDASPGGHVRIAVTDTGPGIDDSIAPRIFDPFFSTRDGGTGLGLATVHGTVVQNGGHIRLHSRPGEGTCFEVLWPHSQRPVASAAPALPRPPPSRSREIVVLLVDDEPAILSSVARLLERHGFRVLTADSAQAARAASARAPAEIDVLVADVMMPDTSGPKLAAELLAAHPSMKVLLMSGYTEDDLGHDQTLRGAVSFISKPFSGEELAQKLRGIVGVSDASHRSRHPAPQTTSVP